MRTIGVLILTATACLAQQQGEPPQGGRGAGQPGGRGGQGGGQAAQAVPSKSVRPTGSSLGTIRIGAQDNNMWFGWHVAVPATAFKGQTYSEAAAKSDAIAVANTVGSSAVRVSYEIPKNLTPSLQPGELRARDH